MRKIAIALSTLALSFALGAGIVSAQSASPTASSSPSASPKASPSPSSTTTMPSGAPNTGHAE